MINQPIDAGRAGSCSVSAEISVPVTDQKEADKVAGFPDDTVKKAKELGITPAKLTSMIEYARLLRKHNPRMKESSIRSKVCLKFNIKLK